MSKINKSILTKSVAKQSMAKKNLAKSIMAKSTMAKTTVTKSPAASSVVKTKQTKSSVVKSGASSKAEDFETAYMYNLSLPMLLPPPGDEDKENLNLETAYNLTLPPRISSPDESPHGTTVASQVGKGPQSTKTGKSKSGKMGKKVKSVKQKSLEAGQPKSSSIIELVKEKKKAVAVAVLVTFAVIICIIVIAVLAQSPDESPEMVSPGNWSAESPTSESSDGKTLSTNKLTKPTVKPKNKSNRKKVV